MDTDCFSDIDEAMLMDEMEDDIDLDYDYMEDLPLPGPIDLRGNGLRR